MADFGGQRDSGASRAWATIWHKAPMERIWWEISVCEVKPGRRVGSRFLESGYMPAQAPSVLTCMWSKHTVSHQLLVKVSICSIGLLIGRVLTQLSAMRLFHFEE